MTFQKEPLRTFEGQNGQLLDCFDRKSKFISRAYYLVNMRDAVSSTNASLVLESYLCQQQIQSTL